MAYLGSQKKVGDIVTMGWQIHIMQADGSNDRAITPPEWTPRYFSWAPVPVLEVGSSYRVTEAGANLDLRQEPSLASRLQRQVPAGEAVLVLEGPVDRDGYFWWRLRTQDGMEGWAVEFLGWYQAVE